MIRPFVLNILSKNYLLFRLTSQVKGREADVDVEKYRVILCVTRNHAGFHLPSKLLQHFSPLSRKTRIGCSPGREVSRARQFLSCYH